MSVPEKTCGRKIALFSVRGDKKERKFPSIADGKQHFYDLNIRPSLWTEITPTKDDNINGMLLGKKHVELRKVISHKFIPFSNVRLVTCSFHVTAAHSD